VDYYPGPGALAAIAATRAERVRYTTNSGVLDALLAERASLKNNQAKSNAPAAASGISDSNTRDSGRSYSELADNGPEVFEDWAGELRSAYQGGASLPGSLPAQIRPLQAAPRTKH